MNQEELIRFGTGRQLAEIDYLSELLSYQSLFKEIQSVSALIHQVQQAIQAINSGYLPDQLPQLAITDAMIADVQNNVLNKFPNQPSKGNALWGQMAEALGNIDFLVRHLRDALIEYFSMYGFVSTPFVQDLSYYTAGYPVLELMAGHGYLSAGLRACQPKQTIIATDNKSWRHQPGVTLRQPVTKVKKMSALSALANYGDSVAVILMSWAPDTSEDDWEVLQAIRTQYRNKKFLVIGEENGATNSKAFWSEAKLKPLLNTHHQSFDLINEQVFEVE
ncbi:SAM-dependent methyltransferase [Weissella paramesenteroides]|jgi:hypothetical protein|uniref:SAM-dependent methyltransferase n=1 Tax=Weissella paramesenteroides TaxID=1249 RepID=UPI002E7B3B1E|nr:SAM-dependent methyltransferase [Weissella paramesenteroides]WPQ67762.1 SAM-dependent methyltransferase [Weissella paramesenteroides]